MWNSLFFWFIFIEVIMKWLISYSNIFDVNLFKGNIIVWYLVVY